MKKRLAAGSIVLIMSLCLACCGRQADNQPAQTAAGTAAEGQAGAGASGESRDGVPAETAEASGELAETPAETAGTPAQGGEEAPAISAFTALPEGQPDETSEFGVDQNVNMDTIDRYLNLSDAVYRDMRMTVDPYDYAAIGGNSVLTGMIEGFSAVPYPYLAPALNMPKEVGEGYSGPTLFTVDGEGNYSPCYEESMAILESIFPKDQVIILMCGAGGYAGMTKNLLVSLGWDEALIYNAGGYWFYQGEHNVELVSGEEAAAGLYHFEGLDLYEFDFSVLTPKR